MHSTHIGGVIYCIKKTAYLSIKCHFFHLPYENRFQSVDLATDQLVDRLLTSMEESPFALRSDNLFLNILRTDYKELRFDH